MSLKNFRLVCNIIITLFSLLIGISVLSYYEYHLALLDIDNVVGALPLVLILVAICAVSLIVWLKYSKKLTPLYIWLAIIAIGSVALFPTSLRGNWWINMQISNQTESKPDLSLYSPFATNSLAATLDDNSTLKLNDSFPIIDGATALYPMYAAFVKAAYNKDAYNPDTVLMTNTRGAYPAIISGERDIIFVAGASKQQMAQADKAGVELVFTPIAKEAFVFLVGKDNPIDNITYQQIRNIYSGKTAQWGTLGWKHGGRIIAFQRPEGSGSQTALQKIMGKIPIQAPQPLPDASLIGSNSLMQQISVQWKGVQPALGYSYRFYATKMYANSQAKILKVNGVMPTEESIQNGEYPFIYEVYAVTNGNAEGNTRLFLDWILSAQGQELIAKTGYVPIK